MCFYLHSTFHWCHVWETHTFVLGFRFNYLQLSVFSFLQPSVSCSRSLLAHGFEITDLKCSLVPHTPLSKQDKKTCSLVPLDTGRKVFPKKPLPCQIALIRNLPPQTQQNHFPVYGLRHSFSDKIMVITNVDLTAGLWPFTNHPQSCLVVEKEKERKQLSLCQCTVTEIVTGPVSSCHFKSWLRQTLCRWSNAQKPCLSLCYL